uniref:Lysozyme n=1 Tax=Chlorobium chlorochromatii (strain CaD3) TaxID=340177 RepID=Q3ASQ2_CHLCH
MQTSDNGLNIIRQYEGLRLKTYFCPAGKLTIGYGHTGTDVTSGMSITEAQANELLQEDVKRFATSVNKMVTTEVTQGMFDALISFSYNIGAGNLQKSTLLKKLNAGDKQGAADEFLKWNKSNGKPLAGLTARRTAERELFLA